MEEDLECQFGRGVLFDEGAGSCHEGLAAGGSQYRERCEYSVSDAWPGYFRLYHVEGGMCAFHGVCSEGYGVFGDSD